MIHPRNPTARRAIVALELTLLTLGLWLGWSMLRREELTIRVTGVDGFTEELQGWMRFNVAVEMTNAIGSTIGIQRIQVEPDLDGVNEAYGAAVPFFSPPLLVEGNSTAKYVAVVTLFNAAQLQERTYDVVFRVRIETEDNAEILMEFPAQLDYFRDPARRTLRTGA